LFPVLSSVVIIVGHQPRQSLNEKHRAEQCLRVSTKGDNRQLPTSHSSVKFSERSTFSASLLPTNISAFLQAPQCHHHQQAKHKPPLLPPRE